MKLKHYILLFIVLLGKICPVLGQNIILYHQFNGRYDFTFIGNTMNLGENNIILNTCEDLLVTSSTATLNLTLNQTVEKAYLYWAGSGLGDLNVKLNNIDITSQRTFSTMSTSNLPYFSAFADVTNQVISTGNGDYTLSDLDISQTLINESGYCENRTNFAGWAILIVYKDTNLPINQINVYDGLQNVPNDLIINLDSLNVLDTNDSKIGFISWEGDAILPTESFYFNGLSLSNPPLNPSNNVFNGTNSITGSSTQYNMDLDIYPLEGYIDINDTTAEIKLTSSQDFIMINTVVTKLNNQLPDATVTIDAIQKECNSRTIIVDYTVSNLIATNPLPAGTPVSIYANGKYIQTILTTVVIPIGGSITGQISIVLPDETPIDFELQFIVDDTGGGIGIVTELVENNNSFSTDVSLWVSPAFTTLEPLVSCNEGFTKGTFNFSNYADLVKVNPEDTVYFYESLEDAANQVNQIFNTSNYVALTTPKEIFIRIKNENCYSITSFLLTTKNCPPTVYNYVSANEDTFNDSFFIAGLHNIFLNYRLEIYNRWGRLIWTGNNEKEDWDGTVIDSYGSKKAPDGTYYYLLFLNDIDNPKPLTGFLFLNR